MPADAAARLRTAAAEEFGAHGFERASLNRIVEASGLSKSSVYHHIGGKQALYDDLVTFVVDLVDAIPPGELAALTRDDFWAAADAALAALDELEGAHPEVRAVASMLYGPHGATALAPLRVRLIDRVSAYLAQGQELGAVRSDIPPDLLADVTVASLTSIDAWALAHDGDPRSAASHALGMLRHALEGG